MYSHRKSSSFVASKRSAKENIFNSWFLQFPNDQKQRDRGPFFSVTDDLFLHHFQGGLYLVWARQNGPQKEVGNKACYFQKGQPQKVASRAPLRKKEIYFSHMTLGGRNDVEKMIKTSPPKMVFASSMHRKILSLCSYVLTKDRNINIYFIKSIFYFINLFSIFIFL